jgi:hypothetical protein
MSAADWPRVHHRVSLTGRVGRDDGGFANGGTLSLTAGVDGDGPRRYEASIRNDGFYYFLDLPGGAYVLGGQDDHGNDIASQPVSIPATPPVTVDLTVAVKRTAANQLPQRRRAPGRSGAAGKER